jgi:hypothetical protein
MKSHYYSEVEKLTNYGRSLIGKMAQSRLLKEINAKGYEVLQSPQKITAFEIIDWMGEPTLMVTLGGGSVFEDTIINIK